MMVDCVYQVHVGLHGCCTCWRIVTRCRRFCFHEFKHISTVVQWLRDGKAVRWICQGNWEEYCNRLARSKAENWAIYQNSSNLRRPFAGKQEEQIYQQKSHQPKQEAKDTRLNWSQFDQNRNSWIPCTIKLYRMWNSFHTQKRQVSRNKWWNCVGPLHRTVPAK